jgi:hypothetical protein
MSILELDKHLYSDTLSDETVHDLIAPFVSLMVALCGQVAWSYGAVFVGGGGGDFVCIVQ